MHCRKLTALPSGEKVSVEFDEDGNEIGPNSSLFSCFLGQQVRNRVVCPVQVNNWEDFKSETLDHLWACILVIYFHNTFLYICFFAVQNLY